MDDELIEIIRRITDAGRGYGIEAFPVPVTNKTFKLKGECSVTGAIDKHIDVLTIPKDLGGCPVTRISRGAFERCIWLESVDIPDVVKSIGRSAFKDCKSLERVAIGEGATSIFDGAFENCTALEEVKLDDGMKTIFKNAFKGCTSLKSVIVPDDAIIEDGAFPEGCKIIRRSDVIEQQAEESDDEAVTLQQPEAVAEDKPVSEVAAETSEEIEEEEFEENKQLLPDYSKTQDDDKIFYVNNHTAKLLKTYGITVIEPTQGRFAVDKARWEKFIASPAGKNYIALRSSFNAAARIVVNDKMSYIGGTDGLSNSLYEEYRGLANNSSGAQVVNVENEKAHAVAMLDYYVDAISKLPLEGYGWDKDTVKLSLINSIENSEIKDCVEEKTFAEQVDAVLNGTYERYSALKVCDTPQILLDVGFEQLPMLYTQRHLRNAIRPKNLNQHYHGLTIDQIKGFPEKMANPVFVIDSIAQPNSVLMVLNDYDIDKCPIITAIKPNGKGSYNLEILDSNFVASFFGRENFRDFIQKSIEQNKILFYNKKESEDLFSVLGQQFPKGLNNLASDTIIRKSSVFVNSNEQKNSENNSETAAEESGATMTRKEKIKALDVQKLAEAYRDNYAEIYENEENYTPEQRERYNQAVTKFDVMRKNPDIADVINGVQNAMGDWITSDREAVAFTFAVEKLLGAEEIEENSNEEVKAMSREQELLNQYGKNMSPMYHDYLMLAVEHPGVIVAQRMGDFYEVFDDNAKKVSELLDLTLTGRDCGLPERVLMAGFPYHTAEDYVNQLAGMGVKMVLSDRLAAENVAEDGQAEIESETVTMYEVGTFTVTTPDGKAETAAEYYKQGKNITQSDYVDMFESESMAREFYDKIQTNVERAISPDGTVTYRHTCSVLSSNVYELDEDGEITGAVDPDAGREITYNMPSYAETARSEAVMLEDAKQNARAIATAEGKPFVVINFSEHSAFKTGDIISLVAAENKFTALNAETKKSKDEGGFEGYYKTGFDIYYIDPKSDGIAGYTGGRFDIGDETSGLIEHIREVVQSSNTMLTESQRAHCMEFVNYLESVVRGEVKEEPEQEAAVPEKKSRQKRAKKSTEEKIINPVETEDFEPKETKSNSAAENIRDEMVKALLESMKKNPEKWEKGWVAATTSPENGSTGKTYRGVNNLYLSLVAEEKGYKDNRWVTFDQARKMKASVKKGEKSAPILYYSQYDKKTKKEFTEATVKGMTAEEREEYIAKNVHCVLKYSRVFNAEQCLNFPEKPSLPEMDEQERARQNAKIENIIKNSAAPVNYDGGNRAYYSPYEDAVHLPEIKTFKTMQDYYATALHEIAHSTGHESRLNRNLKNGEFGDKDYAQEELRAELASVFLQAQTGITLEGSHIDNHGAYLGSWLKYAEEDGGYKKFYAAVSDAQKISDYIIANYLKESEIADISPQETVAVAEDKRADEAPEDVAAEKPEEIKADAPVEEANEKSTEENKKTETPLTAREQKMKNALETFIASDLEESGELSKTTLEAIRMQGFEYVDGKIVKSQPKQTSKNTATARELPVERENAASSDGNSTEPAKTVSAWKRVEIKDDQIGKEYGERVMLRMPADGEYNKYVAFVPKKHIRKSEKTGKTYLSINHGYNYTLNNDGMQVSLNGEQFAAVLNGEEVNVAGERVAPNRINARRIENIDKNAPEDMKSSPNWGVYYVKWNDKKKKYDKITVSAVTGERIKANDPATWATFTDAKEYAMKNNCVGLSYVLDGSISCIDLDHQLKNGELSETAEKLCGELKGTYIERSVSGDGLHIFLRGDYNEDGKYYYKKKLENGDEIEMYGTGKIISMTGDIYADAKSEINICPTATTAWLHKQLERTIPATTSKASTSATSATPHAGSYQRSSRRTASEVEEFILKTKNAQEYADLRAGKLLIGDHSADDFKFLTIVGYYSDNDRSIMQELFTSSGLYRPEKGEDYVRRSIDNAIAAKTRTIGDYLDDKRSARRAAKEAKKGAHP